MSPGGTSDDGGIDAIDAFLIDAPASCVGWNPHHFAPCSIPAPSGPIDLTSGTYTYDTDDGTLTGSSGLVAHAATTIPQAGTPARLISVTSFNVGANATLRVVGAMPLIVAAWDTIKIDGTVDAGSTSSSLGGSLGGGANPALCGIGAGAGETGLASGGSGGGGGGGFRGRGGGGGQGDSPPGPLGGRGGPAVVVPMIVRGGCRGADSGQAGPGVQAPSVATTVSAGGAGGGAIQLTAQHALAINGRVLAGGAGGGGAPMGSDCGGAGGGAGGYIGFEGASVTFAGAIVAANGGGGGASRTYGGGVGLSGVDGQPSAVGAAGGGPDGTCALPGGPGGAGSTLDGTDITVVSGGCGGGGGGGATGFVVVWPTLNANGASTISPSALVNPF